MGELFSIVVTILIIGFLWFWIVRPILEDYGVIASRAVKDYQEAEPRFMSRTTTRTRPIYASEPEPLSSDQFPLPNDAEPYANGSGTAPELYLNEAEVAALQRMIRHNATAAKPSKSSTIQAGFGVSRGGSSAYTRASLIYDALFGAPAPAVKYRQRTPEQEALRQQLRLEKQ